MPPSTKMLLAGASVLTPDGLIEHGTVQINHNRIGEVNTEVPANLLLRQSDEELIPLSSEFVLTPGLIDLQMNGALGCDFNRTHIPAVQAVLGHLPRYGVTGLLPTLITAPLMDMVSSANTLEEVIHISKPRQARILGIHLEGPFLNPSKCGAHPKNSVLSPSLDALQTLLSPNVRFMTLAPERDPHGLVLDTCQQRGLTTFAGHTQANQLQLQQAIERGLCGMTHLMNAMEGFHHRKPGTSLFALNDDRLMATLIADGVHVHPEVLKLLFRVKTPERLLLVSDAMSLAGQPEGTQTTFGEQIVTRQNQTAVNQAGTLSGSVLMLNDMVRNIVKWQLASFAETIQMASANPARVLGLQHELGAIAPGYIADMVLWDRKNLNVVATWVDGQLVWCDTQRLGQAKARMEQQLAAG